MDYVFMQLLYYLFDDLIDMAETDMTALVKEVQKLGLFARKVSLQN
jgi:hypothetical protein